MDELEIVVEQLRVEVMSILFNVYLRYLFIFFMYILIKLILQTEYPS